MEYVNCNCCGSSSYQFVYQKPDEKYFPDEVFDVVECTECGLGFVNPRPSISEIGRFYPSEFFTDFSDNDHSDRYAAQARYLDDITRTVSHPKLLDIGCANGHFPRFMRSKGWDVEGLEISANSEPIHDFKVYRVPFAEADVPKNYFDAITAWAVLEHVHDPMSCFRKAYESLRPGGKFVFLVPNFESLASKKLFREDIPRHLYFFTPNTLQRYVEKNHMVLKQLDFHDKIFSSHSNFWLIWLVYKTMARNFEYHNLPPSYQQEVEKRSWPIDMKTKLYYAARHPIVIFDQWLRPVFDWYAMKSKTYGVMTCIAQRP